MTQPTSAPAPQPSSEGYEINLLDLVAVLAKRKWLILGLTVLVTLGSAVITLFLPDIFVANTKILPPQQNRSSGAAALLQQIGGFGLGGIGSGGGGGNAVYIAMLKSRTVRDKVVQRFGQGKPDEAARPWEADFSTDKEGLIVIEVSDTDPKRAAALANAYVEELGNLSKVIAVTAAAQSRLFLEHQVAQARENLAKAEGAAKQAMERGGLVKVDIQASSLASATGNLRGRIIAREVELGAMRNFAGDRNPDLQRIQYDIDSMRRELSKMEGDSGLSGVPGKLSAQAMESVRLLRDVKLNEVLFELLAKQYEMAKIDEAKDSSVIQVLDPAVVPVGKTKPRRGLIVVAAALVGFLAAILWTLASEALTRMRNDPSKSAQLSDIKRHLSLR